MITVLKVVFSALLVFMTVIVIGLFRLKKEETVKDPLLRQH